MGHGLGLAQQGLAFDQGGGALRHQFLQMQAVALELQFDLFTLGDVMDGADHAHGRPEPSR